jgi:UDP-N-acetyl-D-galactosamine dehydrogenase
MSFLATFPDQQMPSIAIVGLGYVGLPLALAFAEKGLVLGFDIDAQRIARLQKGEDHTLEVDIEVLLQEQVRALKGLGQGLRLSHEEQDLAGQQVYIITVPTPIDAAKSPDLGPLRDASRLVGRYLQPGGVVIYESTVYPGCTEEVCVPLLEEVSGLRLNEGFYVGYSPERVSPGDKLRTLKQIKKVTSGSTKEAAEWIDRLYRQIIEAGTHLAPSIKVAEAAKAIENAQRDVNISFVNELALIFDRMGIDTHDVLDAAATKWNFLPYKPGLVGGHCIGVDPYYLAFKAEQLGYLPNVILSGRRVNEQMGAFVADKVVKLMIQKDQQIKNSRALILGITFKENCPDIRNTRVVDIYHELEQFGVQVDVYDPMADADEVQRAYGLALLKDLPSEPTYEAVVLAVAHECFQKLDIIALKKENGVVFDTKACLDRALVDGRL